ncbi:glucose 1-dehydrogenase [Desulfocurvibacter africanus]|uniref:glucose 1-dehydrogenase n=1 Tax=Desulfocurvibacter africanus TaxID=873 RepID=UPI002FD885F6
MDFFHDKVALVTGGGQGIGLAVTQAFLDRGSSVVILERDAEAAGQGAESGRVLAVCGDVAAEADVLAAVGTATREFGRLDFLVNNAGISEFMPLELCSLDDWNRIIGVNLTGMFLCAKHAAPALRASRGAMINIASTRAFQSEPGSEAYAASKGGIVALTHALALSLGPHVRVNCIAPGWIDVSNWKKRSAREQAELRSVDHEQHPAGRVGRPEDVAEAALFLCSDKAGFITGECLVLDGGMTRKMIYAE